MSERTLILLRHAKSDWSGEEPDIDRPLAKRGRRQAPDTGRWLARSIPGIDLALVSPAVRTRQTWDLVCRELGRRPKTRFDDRLYAASDQALLGVVQELPDRLETVVLVGHSPGLPDLVLLLTGDSVPMPTSAVAVVVLPGSWGTTGQARGELVASGRPPAP